jgi:hypothetical protein
MRRDGNLKLQRRGRGDFDFHLGAHFSSHHAILRQSLRNRQLDKRDFDQITADGIEGEIMGAIDGKHSSASASLHAVSKTSALVKGASNASMVKRPTAIISLPKCTSVFRARVEPSKTTLRALSIWPINPSGTLPPRYSFNT